MTIDYQESFQQLYQVTAQIRGIVQNIELDMDGNELEELERLQSVVEQRGQIIAQLDEYMQHDTIHWSSKEKEQIQQLKQWEEEIQPVMERIFRDFSAQMNKFKQGRQMAFYYGGAYGNDMDGAFIDKRK